MACSQVLSFSAASCRSPVASTSASAFARGTPVNSGRVAFRVAPRNAALCIEARYRGVGTDRSAVAQFKREESDCGSPEVQIAQLTARVTQLTAHLKEHRKDYSTTRGLMKLLSRRKSLMEYLKKHNRSKYEEVVATLGIRALKEIVA